MRRRWVGLSAVGFVLILVLVAGSVHFCIQEDKHPEKFIEVVPGKIYRSGQPTEEQLRVLRKEIGLKTIVNLRSQRDSRHDDRVKEEAEFASKEGVTLFEIVLNPPTDENVKALLKVLDDERNYPVLVHCEHGKDRTGVAIAIFRMERMGWTSGQALMEMFEAGQGERLRYLDINESDRFVARYRPRFALHPSETPGVAPSPNRR